MTHDASSFDQRLTELQSQLDRLAVTLQHWREHQDHLKPAEERLADLTNRCVEVVDQWSATSDRQERAVQQLEERVSAFSALEDRLHQDAAHRIRALERTIEQEWSGLRQLHQAPVRELREQAAALGQLSIAAANSSATGLERAEARLADIERTLHHHLTGVSQRLDAAVAEIRTHAVEKAPGRAPEPAQPSGAAGPSWPIEGVVRLHNQLRESAESQRAVGSPMKPLSMPQLVLPAHDPEIEARLDSLEQAIADRTTELHEATDRHRRHSRLTWVGLVLSALVLMAVGGAGFVLRQEARTAAGRAAAAETQAQAAMASASQQVSVVREEAARQVTEAREEAARAQAVGDVLAAPDIVRYSVGRSGRNAVNGQVLWSRTRGVVFSGVRLPPAPTDMVYQLWLITESAPVGAGTFMPDAEGRVTFVAPPPDVPRPVVGAALTVEPVGGSQVPSDPSLTRSRPTPQLP